MTPEERIPAGPDPVHLGNGVLPWCGEIPDFDGVVARAGELGATVVLPPLRNPPEGDGNGPGHREIWVKGPGEAFEPTPTAGS